MAFAGVEFILVFGDDHPHVVADGLGQAGGGHPDQLRGILSGDVLQPELEVGGAAVDRVLFPSDEEAISIGSLKWLMM